MSDKTIGCRTLDDDESSLSLGFQDKKQRSKIGLFGHCGHFVTDIKCYGVGISNKSPELSSDGLPAAGSK